MKSSRGFTLIELLVVITIIVVLLALLAPALDKALYEAEMAKDGAQLKGIAAGGTVYAMANKRYYPAPISVPDVPWAAFIGSGDGGYPGDRRNVWQEAVGSINAAFQCPLVDANLNLETTQSDHISANYEIFAGWGYNGNPLLRRVGDKLVYNDTTSSRPGLRKYDVLAGDRNLVQRPTDLQSSHPDSDGKLSLLVARDDPDPWGFPTIRTTTSLWWSFGRGVDRGTVNSNFAATDTSVRRINAIEADHYQSEMGRVPVYPGAQGWENGDTAWMYVPLN